MKKVEEGGCNYEKNRNSNIELLRLVLMVFVVLLHFNNDTMGLFFSKR